MAVECEHRILPTHAGTVVAHLDQRLAALLEAHPHTPRVGVERVLDQLLDYRRRPLDHFTGGDLIGDGIGQDGDPPRHRRQLPRSITRESIGTHPSRPPGASTMAQPGARRTTRTAVPGSSGAIEGARS